MRGTAPHGDRAIAAGADIETALAGRLHPASAAAAHQAEDAEAGPEALLGVGLGGHDRLDHGGRFGADRRSITA
ncbi:hypothetical protein ACLF3G_27335 [Falsiroseomonas sp. HC035]|uniref:hypothetical protein n=1 Tax=Falsiroseomonas sp. HC035 TaxID=3390999 RepID=UPI003D3124EE